MFLHFLFKRPKGTLFPVAVALWSLAVAVLISYGRASLQQQEGGIASRYTTFILPLVWTLLLYLALWSGRFGKLWRRIIIFSSCLAALLFLGHNLTALWERLDAQCIHNSRLQYLLLTADIHPDDNMVPPKILEGRGNFFKAAKVREFVAILRDKGLNAFADVEEEKPPFAEKKSLGEPANGFALEALSIEKGKLNAEPFLRLVGWAFDATANKPARSVWLTIGTGTDERRLPLFYGTINRQQIADYLRNKELNRVGFEGDFTLKTIHPGVYPLSLEIVSSDGLAFWRFAVPCQLFVNEGSWRLQSPDGDTCQPGIPVRERIMAVPAAGEVVGRLDEARLEHGANGPELFVRGWARDPKQQLPATAVTLEAGERQFPLAYGINRPDVGQHFKTGKLNRTGFQAQIPLSFLTPGRYPLSLRVDARFDAFYFFVDSGFKLVSRDGDWHLEKQR